MYKYILVLSIILLTAFVCSTICWWNVQFHAQDNSCTLSDLVNDPSAVERAILKMGPYRNYLITADGRLLVKQDGEWLILNYGKGG